MTETTRESNHIDTNGRVAAATQIRLNLGCGGSWQADGWCGIDQRSGSGTWEGSREPRFFDLDVKRGLPFPANSVDVVFSSHTLEQFTHEEALALLFEIHRVLKVGAPLCLVVADLDTYIRNYIDRNEAFLTAPEIIGGSPRDNLTDNFLMTFYADPRFDNTGHKYAYNFENLSSTLQLAGFEQIQKVSYHDFSYWPELRGAEFRSPMKAFERFSLSAQCRKVRHDPNFRARAEFRQTITYARSHESERQASNSFTSAVFTTEQTRSVLSALTEKIDGLELSLRQSRENEAALTQEIAAMRDRRDETQQPNHKALRASLEAATEYKEIAAELDRQRKRSGELERIKRVHEANWRAFRESIPQLTKRLAQAVFDWPRTRRRDRTCYRLISTSDWFDAAWYKSTYPDVAQSGADPAWHYLHHGAAEGRNPSPRFNTNLYLALYPDVEQAGVNPLAHFVQFGIAERRCPARSS